MTPEKPHEPVGEQHLQASFMMDKDHEAIVAYAHEHGRGATDVEKAVALFYAVRDGFRYDPYQIVFSEAGFRASEVVQREPAYGHCIDKANVLASSARVLGIPSRLHFANVKNHLGTARLEKMLGSDLLVFHGWCELFLNGKWVAATPAFNAGLCHRLGVVPLEFDGTSDCRFQAFDRKVGSFMSTVKDHGAFSDIPFQKMLQAWISNYPVVADAIREFASSK